MCFVWEKGRKQIFRLSINVTHTQAQHCDNIFKISTHIIINISVSRVIQIIIGLYNDCVCS